MADKNQVEDWQIADVADRNKVSADEVREKLSDFGGDLDAVEGYYIEQRGIDGEIDEIVEEDVDM
jgi:hypothetical protein